MITWSMYFLPVIHARKNCISIRVIFNLKIYLWLPASKVKMHGPPVSPCLLYTSPAFNVNSPGDNGGNNVDITTGIDYGQYPVARTIMFGISASF